MQLHQVQRRMKQKRARRVGRGGKRGKTSGRGHKGQKARAGRKIRPEVRDIIKRIPKLRGRGKNIFTSIQEKPAVVNVKALEVFADGASVTPETLLAQGLVRPRKGMVARVKVLGDGTLTKKLSVSGCSVSAGARAKIEAAGGTVRP